MRLLSCESSKLSCSYAYFGSGRKIAKSLVFGSRGNVSTMTEVCQTDSPRKQRYDTAIITDANSAECAKGSMMLSDHMVISMI